MRFDALLSENLWVWSLLVLPPLCYYVVTYTLSLIKTRRLCRELITKDGCEPLKCLPNSWLLPLGLDKLRKVIIAERLKAYPILMLEDHDKFGDTYAQGGVLYTIITRDPQNVRAVLSRKFKNFEIGQGRHGCLAPLLGDGIFTQDGPKWERSRKCLAPILQRPSISGLDLLENHFQQLLSKVCALESGGQSAVLDMKGPFFGMSLNVTTEFLLGSSIWISDKDPSVSKIRGPVFAKTLDNAFNWIAKRERLKIFHWLIDGLDFRRSCNDAQAMIDRLIARSREAIQRGNDAEQKFAFAKLLEENTEPGFLRDQFLNLLLAGRDTSASLLCWAFYVLGREPGVLKQLKEEIRTYLGTDRNTLPTRDHLGQMKTLDYFISETLRLFPPVPLNGRFCVETTTLPRGGGRDGESPIIVPKGTLVGFSTFATHNSSKWYGEDARKFSLRRWEETSVNVRTADWTFNPFIGGPRKCLGERFAIEQAKYITCRFLQHLDNIVAVDAEGNDLSDEYLENWVDRVEYHVALTMSPGSGVWVRLIPTK